MGGCPGRGMSSAEPPQAFVRASGVPLCVGTHGAFGKRTDITLRSPSSTSRSLRLSSSFRSCAAGSRREDAAVLRAELTSRAASSVRSRAT